MACLLETPIRMSVLSVSDPPGAGQPRFCPQHYPGTLSLPSTTPCGGLRWDARDLGRVGGVSFSRAPTGAGSQDSVRQTGRSGSRQPAHGRGLGLAKLSPVFLPALLLLRTELPACEGSGQAWNLESTSLSWAVARRDANSYAATAQSCQARALHLLSSLYIPDTCQGRSLLGSGGFHISCNSRYCVWLFKTPLLCSAVKVRALRLEKTMFLMFFFKKSRNILGGTKSGNKKK